MIRLRVRKVVRDKKLAADVGDLVFVDIVEGGFLDLKMGEYEDSDRTGRWLLTTIATGEIAGLGFKQVAGYRKLRKGMELIPVATPIIGVER